MFSGGLRATQKILAFGKKSMPIWGFGRKRRFAVREQWGSQEIGIGNHE